MSRESSSLPPKWFAIAAIFALLFAAGVSSLLLYSSHGSNKLPAQQEQLGGKSDEAPSDTSSPPSLYLKQSDAVGAPISWGAIAPGSFARVEVVGAEPTQFIGTDFFLSKDGSPEQKISSQRFHFEYTSLSPGRYRWHANLKGKLPKNIVTLKTSHADLQGFDFVIVPAALALSQLQQVQFNAEPIGSDLRARNGVRMRAHLNFPGSLEVEVKPAGSPFNGKDILASPSSDNGVAEVLFQGSDGPYHWRARAMATELATSKWVEFRTLHNKDSNLLDFDLFNTKKPKSESALPSVDGVNSTAYSSVGTNKPRDSIVQQQAPMWSLILTWEIIVVALASIAVLAYLLWHQRKNRPEGKHR